MTLTYKIGPIFCTNTTNMYRILLSHLSKDSYCVFTTGTLLIKVEKNLRRIFKISYVISLTLCYSVYMPAKAHWEPRKYFFTKGEVCFLHIKPYNRDFSNHIQYSTSRFWRGVQCWELKLIDDVTAVIHNGFKGAFPESFKKHNNCSFSKTTNSPSGQ